MNGRGFRARMGLAVMAVASSVLLGGCGSWEGLNSLAIPGGEGRGADAYAVRIEMPNVTSITPNSPVLVNDVTVGRIDSIEVEDWHAVVTVSLNGDVSLPHNAIAAVGQTSLLGSQHIALATHPIEKPEGRLREGDTIPLANATQYPTTEQTLAALSSVVSGGSMAQLETITRELNSMLGGREGDLRELVGRIDELVKLLDGQKGEIVTAMEGLDDVARVASSQNETLARALDTMPEATKILADQRDKLTEALVTMGDFGREADRVVRASREDLEAELRALEPTLKALADSGNDLTGVMNILVTFPFPQEAIDRFIRGDYANLYIQYDMTVPRMREGMLLGTPLGVSMAVNQAILGRPVAPTISVDPLENLVNPRFPTPEELKLPEIPGLTPPAPRAQDGGN